MQKVVGSTPITRSSSEANDVVRLAFLFQKLFGRCSVACDCVDLAHCVSA